MVALGYLAITLPLIRLVNFLEKRLRSGLGREWARDRGISSS